MIALFLASTPNGIKTTIVLEELGLPDRARGNSFSKHEQKEGIWYLAINPNGRISAILGHDSDGL